MPIDPSLVEAKWKSAGLTKRTADEKKKFKKTGVSEALRAYATAAALGVGQAAEKKAKLKALKTVLIKCAADHKTNGPFVAYVTQVEAGVGREVTRLNGEITALTLDGAMNNTGEYAAFLAYAKTTHSEENLEFLSAVKAGVAPAKLIPTYVAVGSPKEVNIDNATRQNWVGAPANSGFKAKAVEEVENLVINDTLRKYKALLKIAL